MLARTKEKIRERDINAGKRGESAGTSNEQSEFGHMYNERQDHSHKRQMLIDFPILDLEGEADG